MGNNHETTGHWQWDIYIGEDLVREEPLEGIAWIAFENAKLCGPATMVQRWVGPGYDPVLHSPRVWRGIAEEAIPRCPPGDCPAQKIGDSGFYTQPRPTALRIETVGPTPRCGYLLRPGCRGGQAADYQPCLRGAFTRARTGQ